VYWCVLPARSRLGRGGGWSPAADLNVIVRGPARPVPDNCRLAAVMAKEREFFFLLKERLGDAHLAQESPDEATEFACERDGDLGFNNATTDQMTAALMEPGLHLPAQFLVRRR
jgi:hypothetical protein